MIRAAILSALLALATAQQFNECPERYGLQLYPHPTSCNEFYKCANGTLTYEVCENGLLFDGKGAVHNHCNYHWAVDCGERQADLTPLGNGICEYSFGIYSNGACETDYTLCTYGEPKYEPCTPGLAYDERIHGCNWPDLMEYCVPQDIVGFECPAYVDSKDPAARFLPHPRYPTQDCGRYIVCVEGNPRLVGCGDSTVFNPNTLTCEDPEYVPSCANYFKK
ncbi:protein obstructor-E-like [Portunus trituberculatus]|uniref:protein obstructor-E-like n=1 Tax=Portunus trituberculatus TaxID=210409 RepID=UPI001E1CF79F|nr:protein obstructor-E-like [Portunus trituberculatus]